MENSKLNKILSINLDRYFDWLESIFIDQVATLKKANLKDSEDTPKFLKDKYNEWVKLANKQPVKVLKNPDRLNWSKLAESFGTSLIEHNDIPNIKDYLDTGLGVDVKAFEKRAEFGLRIEDEISIKVESIDFDIYDSIIYPRPLFKNWLVNGTANFLSDVKYIQYLNGLTTSNNKKTNDRKTISLPEKIMLLNELGFFDLDKVQNIMLLGRKRDEIIGLLLSGDITNTRKNLNALSNPTKTYNPYHHKGILDKIKSS